MTYSEADRRALESGKDSYPPSHLGNILFVLSVGMVRVLWRVPVRGARLRSANGEFSGESTAIYGAFYCSG
jgi:hypothetical protein